MGLLLIAFDLVFFLLLCLVVLVLSSFLFASHLSFSFSRLTSAPLFLLLSTGFEVTKKTYDGSISHISPDFRSLLNQYVRLLFNEELEPKMIHHRYITGPELKNFFKVYVRLFQPNEGKGKLFIE
jgi:hypothetical protein